VFPADYSPLASRIKRNGPSATGPNGAMLRPRALLLPGQLDGNAQQQLAIAFFHLSQ
jgi:hypothetical protein